MKTSWNLNFTETSAQTAELFLPVTKPLEIAKPQRLYTFLKFRPAPFTEGSKVKIKTCPQTLNIACKSTAPAGVTILATTKDLTLNAYLELIGVHLQFDLSTLLWFIPVVTLTRLTLYGTFWKPTDVILSTSVAVLVYFLCPQWYQSVMWILFMITASFFFYLCCELLLIWLLTAYYCDRFGLVDYNMYPIKHFILAKMYVRSSLSDPQRRRTSSTQWPHITLHVLTLFASVLSHF